MKPGRFGPWPLLSAGAFVVYGVVVGLPLLWILGMLATAFTETDFGTIFGPRPLGLLWNSLAVAGGTTLLALALGVPLAVLLTRFRLPGRKMLLFLSLLPVIIPLPLRGIAWTTLCLPEGIVNRTLQALFGLENPPLDAYGLDATIIVLGLAWFPIVLWTTAFGLAASPRELEEDGILDASARRVLPRVSLRLAAPSTALGAVVVFALALAEFDIPLLLDVNVYPVQIHLYFQGSSDLAGAVRAWYPVGLLLLPLGFAGLRVSRRLAVGRYTLSLDSPLLFRPGVGGWAGFAAAVLVLVVPLATDLTVLFWRAGSDPSSYVEAWTAAAEETGWSLVTCLLASLLMVTLAYGLLGPSRARRYPGWVWLLLLLPLFISPPVLGLALMAVWNHDPVFAVYDSVAMLVFASTLRYLPVALLVVAAGLSLWPRQLEEAAVVEGAGGRATFLGIFVPLTLPALLAAGGLAFLLTLMETGASIQVVPPGMTTLALRLHQFMHYGPDYYVAALALGLTGLVLILGVLVMAAVRAAVRRTENL